LNSKRPTSVAELTQIVIDADHNNQKISIVGAGKSTGGQTYAPGSIQIDMSALNKLIQINIDNKIITVQPGITWGEIQQIVDPLGLSIISMQSYCDFSVGGSLSVNAHGQDNHYGSISTTVQSLELLMANGSLVTCSRTQNPELFSCVLGGYGLFGIVTQVTLQLTDNIAMVRESRIDSMQDGFALFNKMLRAKDIVFFSSRLSVDPENLYNTALTITYSKSDATPEKLQETSAIHHFLEKTFFELLRTQNFIKKCRFFFGKLFFERSGSIISRNNFMHSSIQQLICDETKGKDILQEYFIPINKCQQFIQKARTILKKHRVNILNTTIRSVPRINDSVLSYARQDCFSFVLYVHIDNNKHAYTTTQKWTRQLIDAALECQGSFYLPYQHLATKEQLIKAYPQWDSFIALKKKYDAQELFINELYLRYC